MIEYSKKIAYCKYSLIYLITCLFLAYTMALQVSPGVMSQELLHDLHINAHHLGLLSAFFFYAYTAMQIPAGVIYDRFSTRYTTAGALLLCIIGTMIFSHYRVFLINGLGRLLMGLGSAFSFIAVLTVAAYHFPKRYYPIFCGITQTVAAAGAAFGLTPLAHMIHQSTWHHALLYFCYFAGILLIANLLFMTDDMENKNSKTTGNPIWKQLKQIISKPINLWFALFSFCNWGPMIIFSGLWGVPFFTQVYHLPVHLAASLVTCTWVGVMIGGVTISSIASYWNRTLPLLKIASLLGVMTSSILLSVHIDSYILLCALTICFGIACCGQILIFPMAKEKNDPLYTSTLIGFINMAVVAGGIILQPLVGFLLTIFSHHSNLAGQINIYSATNFQHALYIIPICFLINLYISFYRIKLN